MKKLISNLSFILPIIFPFIGIKAQLPSADFSFSSNVCREERLQIVNTSTNAEYYKWDFCEGDLFEQPLTSVAGLLETAFNPKDIELKKFGNNWYGFVTSRSTNTIYKVSYGSVLNNQWPIITNLGNFGNLISGPETIKVIEENGNWVALVVNAGSSTIVRLSFGVDLNNNQPLAEEVVTGLEIGNNGMDIGISANQIVIVLANAISNKLTIINFGNSIQNNPSPTDIITSSSIAGAAGLDDLALIKQNGNWFAFLVAFNSHTIHRLDFGNNLFSIPNVVDITGPPLAMEERPSGIQVKWDKGILVAFIQTFAGSLYRLNFGSMITNTTPIITKVITEGTITNIVNLDMIKDNSTWYGFVIDVVNLAIIRLDFPSLCPSNYRTSVLPEPDNISYDTAGPYFISLTAIDLLGNISYTAKQITVSGIQAPAVDFSFKNFCSNANVYFSFLNNPQNISTYLWDFGDEGISFVMNPTHVYVADSTYKVSLKITDDNNCNNFVKKNIKIYNSPTSVFTLPSGLICTNNEFTFINNTTDNFDGNLTYEWYVNDTLKNTARDFKYIFASGGDKEIKLKTAIPGCYDENIQTIGNVQTGPAVGFIINGKCENELISFTNNSSGSISGYLWDLDEGSSSAETNPSKLFLPGNYVISLQATGTNGCISTISKNLTIYSQPKPDFSLNLPPFSCSGSPSQFTNSTSSPTDSNIASWLWSFGDIANGSSSSKEPTYIYNVASDYSVTLTATTNFGCTAAKQKTITISQSPVAAFANTTACVNQGTLFTDNSSGSIKSRLWSVENSTYSSNNPTHIFSSSGSFDVNLIVTGNNSCISTITKTIVVPSLTFLDFSVQNPCETQPVIFTETTLGNDNASNSYWEVESTVKSGSSTQHVFDQPGTYLVKFNSTRQSGCSYSVSKNIVINPIPVSKFTPSNEWGTSPLTVQFTNESAGASSYQWNFHDQNNSISNQSSPTFVFTELGEYVVNLTATNTFGCSSTTSGKINVVIPSIDVDLKELTLIKDATTGTYQMLVTIKNAGNFPVNDMDVLIYISGNATIKEKINTRLIPDAELFQVLSNQILPLSSITYLCAELDVKNDRDKGNNKKCESVNEKAIVFSPYPNPSNGLFQFDWIAPETEEAHLSIINSAGQVVFEEVVEESQKGINQIQIDLRTLSSGAFYLKFVSGSISRTLPIFILK